MHLRRSSRSTASRGCSAISTRTSSSSCPSCRRRSRARSSVTSCASGRPLLPKKIAVLPCDGAGKEVVPEAIKVLRAAGADFEFEEFDVNADAYLRTGVAIPDDTWKQVASADAILFGAVGDPRLPDAAYLAGVLLRLRFELDLYVNLRPARLYDDRLSPLRRDDRRQVDLMIVRENTEGLYVGDRKSTRLNSSHVAISYAVF